MTVLGPYEKARRYIERHYNDSDEARHQKRKLNPGPIITISRETGIGANFICEKLTEYFNGRAIKGYDDWTYFDRELMEKIMDDHHLPEHFKKYLSEEKPQSLDSWFSEILGVSPSKLLLLHKTKQTVLNLAGFGNVILVGRGGNIIAASLPKAFHIRLVAPLDFRIENAMMLYSLEKKKAIDFIREEDEARKNYIWKYFHKNVEDPLLYHAVINTSCLRVEEIADMIGHCVTKRFPAFFEK